MPNVNNEMPTSAEHSFGFADEPLDDDAFGDIFIDTGGFDDNGNWEEGTGKAIGRSATEGPYAHLDRKFGDKAIGIFTQWSIDGLSPSDIATSSESEQYADWLSLIDDNTRLNIESLGRSRGIHETIRTEIAASAPYLLEGRLSPQQEEALKAKYYTLGVNQSGTFTLDEAKKYLDENNGIETTSYGLDQRFILLSERNKEEDGVIERAVIDGYYRNPRIGRFIIAIPTNTPESNPIAAADNIVDFQRTQNDSRSVNPKYIAGVIDDTGVYHQNKNFSISSEPLF